MHNEAPCPRQIDDEVKACSRKIMQHSSNHISNFFTCASLLSQNKAHVQGGSMVSEMRLKCWEHGVRYNTLSKNCITNLFSPFFLHRAPRFFALYLNTPPCMEDSFLSWRSLPLITHRPSTISSIKPSMLYAGARLLLLASASATNTGIKDLTNASLGLVLYQFQYHSRTYLI